MNLLVSIVHGLAGFWYDLAGWLPLPFQAISFVIVSVIGLHVGLRHVIPPLARLSAGPLRLLLRGLAWGLAAPEFAVTSFLLRRDSRMPLGAFSYGEALAVLLEHAEKAATMFLRWLQKSPKVASHAPIWGVAVVIFLVNAAAYQGHEPLPLSLWWNSMQAWAKSVH